MNNITSLLYFIPELILLSVIFILFLTHDSPRRNLIVNKKVFVSFGILASLIVNIFRWSDPYHGLFYNSITIDPFTGLFSLIILSATFMLTLSDFLSPGSSLNDESSLLHKMLILTASILLIESNNLIMLFLCSGLIGIAGIGLFRTDPISQSKRQYIKSFITFNLLSLSILLFGFSLLYGLSGSLFFQSMSQGMTLISNHTFVSCVLLTLILFGLGFHAGILFYYSSFTKIGFEFNFSISSITLFIPSIAYLGVFIRLVNLTLIIDGLSNTAIGYQGLFIAILALMVVTTANFLYNRKKNLKELLILAVLIHSGFILAGISVLNPDSISASIYLTISTVIIFTGLYSAQKTCSQSDKIRRFFRIIFFLGLIGFPGTTGFTARFLLFKSLFQSSIPAWVTILLILNLLPIVFYFTSLILKSVQQIPGNKRIHLTVIQVLIPSILGILSIGLGIFWEPFYRFINESLVFFKF
ncbi:hypothetical protein KJ656_12515 [bacterium]|nr:hypothetical protein [bacterium]